jgi:hypothetical protein
MVRLGGLVRLHLSAAVVLEYEEVLLRELVPDFFSPEEIGAFLDDLILVSVRHGRIAAIRPMSSDPEPLRSRMPDGLLALGGVAGAAAAIVFSFGISKLWKFHKVALVLIVIFMVTVINSVVQSAAPMYQLIYGAYGRNTGLVTYLLLTLLFLAAASLSNKNSFTKISYGLMAAGFINAIYSLWVTLFGDFIGWTNPYGNILGTFGNPNFVGAFLGIFATVLFAYLIKPDLGVPLRIGAGITLLITFFEIKESSAIQGVVVGAGGIALVGFYFLRSKFKSALIPAIYTLAVSGVGVVAVLGALQKGPLTSLIYKNSVSLRGEYWQAAWNMSKDFPLSGVGMDTYGDWYRRLRDDQALINPGPNTISNAAHNVVLDQLAFDTGNCGFHGWFNFHWCFNLLYRFNFLCRQYLLCLKLSFGLCLCLCLALPIGFCNC